MLSINDLIIQASSVAFALVVTFEDVLDSDPIHLFRALRRDLLYRVYDALLP